jgi:hypothetical protein
VRVGVEVFAGELWEGKGREGKGREGNNSSSHLCPMREQTHFSFSLWG